MRPTRRRTRLALAALAVLVAGPALTATTSTSATAANAPVPRDFTGYGFDQCDAPTQRKMDAWLQHSPYWAVGIYISGKSRACLKQANLTPTWVATQIRNGWRLLPITLGPQASCSTRFPRYGNDPVIKADPTNNYAKARSMGRAEAQEAVRVASRDALASNAGVGNAVGNAADADAAVCTSVVGRTPARWSA